MTTGPVLFVGGSGTVGRHAVGWFRKRHPGVPVLVGGRDLEAAGRVATEAGDAAAVAIDLDTPGLGLDDDVAVSAVVMLAPDSALTGLRYAQDSGIPYLNISTGLIEVGPDVALFTHRPAAAPVVLDSHWGGGAALFLALDAARACQTVRSIRVGVVLDERDPAGPSALEDMERLGRASAAFAFAGGRRVWLSSDDADGQVTAIDGRLLSANAFSSLDIMSLYAATGASDVRFDLATGESSSRRRGGAVAAEIVVTSTAKPTERRCERGRCWSSPTDRPRSPPCPSSSCSRLCWDGTAGPPPPLVCTCPSCSSTPTGSWTSSATRERSSRRIFASSSRRRSGTTAHDFAGLSSPWSTASSCSALRPPRTPAPSSSRWRTSIMFVRTAPRSRLICRAAPAAAPWTAPAPAACDALALLEPSAA